MGLRRPICNDAELSQRLPAFEALVDAHYRYYQHYGSSFVAIAVAFFVAISSHQIPREQFSFWLAAFVLLELLFLVTSRDNLQHYYRRASRLLGEMEREEVKRVERPQEAKTVEAGESQT